APLPVVCTILLLTISTVTDAEHYPESPAARLRSPMASHEPITHTSMYVQLIGLLLSGLCSSAELPTETVPRALTPCDKVRPATGAVLSDSKSGFPLFCASHPDDPGALLVGTLTMPLPPEVAADGGSYISDEICFWSLSGGGVDILLESPNGLYPRDSLMWSLLIEAVLKVSHDRGYINCSSHVRVLLITSSPPAPSPGGATPIIMHEGDGCAEP